MKKWLQLLAPYYLDSEKRRGVVEQLTAGYWWAKVQRVLASNATPLLSSNTEEPTVAIEWNLAERKSDTRKRRWDKLAAAEPWSAGPWAVL